MPTFSDDQNRFHVQVAQLTRTQKQVIKLFLQGYSDGAIAEQLDIADSTVRQHISRIANKLKISSDKTDKGFRRRELLQLFRKFKPNGYSVADSSDSDQSQIPQIDSEAVKAEIISDDPLLNDPNFVGREEGSCNIDDYITSSNNVDVDFVAYDSAWVGRHQTITFLKQNISNLARVIILNGITGIGKTALAEKLYKELITEQKWTKLLRINFDNQDQADFGNFSAVAAHWLQECSILVTPEDRRDTLRLRTSLITYLEKNSCLIIIDSLEWILKGNQENGWSEFKDREWVNFLRMFLSITHSNSRIIITTQHLPEDVSAGYDNFWFCQPIKGLNFSEQIELFEKLKLKIESDNELSYLKRIGKVYEGHPLTLKVIAGTIKKMYRGNIVAYWKEEGKEEVEKVERDLETSQKNIANAWNLHKSNRDLYFKVRYRLNKTFERLKQYNYHAYLLICLISTYLKPHSKEDCLEHLIDEGCNQKEQRIALQILMEEQLLETIIGRKRVLFRLHNLIRSIAYEHFEGLD